jgi:hypothetical protein
VSGSIYHKGARTHVYLLQSPDLNFTGDFDDRPLYYCYEWGNKSWPRAGIYPPNIVWMDGSGFAGVKGYSSPSKPYKFDADLVFVESPRRVSINSFYSKIDSHQAYFNNHLGVNDTQRSVPVIQDGVVWFFVRTGIGYDAVGNVLSLTGFWINETVRISPGYNPLYHYTSLPTKEEYDSMLNLTLYTLFHDANVTITNFKKSGPEYCRLLVDGVIGDTVIVHIKNSIEDMVYLHVEKTKAGILIILSNSAEGSMKNLTPIDNSIIFSLNLN